MAQFTLTLDTDNSAFAESNGTEIARILRGVAETAADWYSFSNGDGGNLRDVNGQNVGRWQYSS